MRRSFDTQFLHSLIDFANDKFDCKHHYPTYTPVSYLFVEDKVKILNNYREHGTVLFKLYSSQENTYAYRKWYLTTMADKWTGEPITSDYFDSFGD